MPQRHRSLEKRWVFLQGRFTASHYNFCRLPTEKWQHSAIKQVPFGSKPPISPYFTCFSSQSSIPATPDPQDPAKSTCRISRIFGEFAGMQGPASISSGSGSPFPSRSRFATLFPKCCAPLSPGFANHTWKDDVRQCPFFSDMIAIFDNWKRRRQATSFKVTCLLLPEIIRTNLELYLA